MIQDPEFPVDLFTNQVQQKGEYFSAHWHEHMELHYILKGRATFNCNHRIISAEEGDVIIINSNELHSGSCDTGSLEAIVIIFQMDSFSRELVYQNVLFQVLIENDLWLRELFSTIYKENEKKEIGYKLVCKGMLFELIAYLVRNYAVLNLSEKENLKRKQDLERLNTVLKYIALHYDEKISVARLAEIMHVSESRFGHLFKESVGISPLNYINEFRLKKALPLLRKQELNVSEIAMEVGFDDMNHFGRLFKKYYGTTPTEMRNNSRIV